MDNTEMTAVYRDLFAKLAESPRARANKAEFLDAAMRLISSNLSILMPDMGPQELEEKVALARVFASELIVFFVRMTEEREANILAQLKMVSEMWTGISQDQEELVEAFIAKRLAVANEVDNAAKA